MPRRTVATAALGLALAWIAAAAAEGLPPGEARVTQLYAHALPDLPGKSLKGVLVEYGPGGYSPGHTHPKSAFIYATVLEGATRSQVNDGPVTPTRPARASPSCPATATPSALMPARRSQPGSSRCSSWTRASRS